MKRWLYATRTVVGDRDRLAERLRGEVRDLLRTATGTTDDAVAVDGSFLLRMPGEFTGLKLSKTVRASTGVATEVDRVARRFSLPLEWHAEPGRLAFPTFKGAIELTGLSDIHSELTLVGAVTLPLGPVGATADAVALGRVADRTVERLVEALAQALRVQDVNPTAAAEIITPATALKVRDLMTRDPMVVDADTPVRTAALLLHHYGVHGAPVVDRHGGLVGVLSEADLLEKEAAPRYGFGVSESWRRREARTAGEACSRPARVTVPEATLHDAARELLDARVARLVVVDQSRVAGILSRSDVLRALLRTDAELQAAVDALLAGLGAQQVRGTVEWGQVTLRGSVELRSRVDVVLAAVRAIDGVTDVEGELGWAEDDTVVPMTPFM